MGAYDGSYFAEDYFFGCGKAVGEAVGEGLGFFEVGEVVDRDLDRGVTGALDGDVGEAGDGSAGGADLFERDDPAATDRQQWFDGERRTEEGLSRADAAAAAEVLEGVDVEVRRDRRHPRAGRGLDAGLVLPAAAAAAAARTGNPRPMPSERESTTRTGIGDSLAPIMAASTVPDISPERWIDTTDSAPSFAQAAYVSAKVCGAGRLVDTGVKVLSASATASVEVAPSSYDVPPMTTWSGTTVSGWRSTSCVASPAVESVTTCTRADMKRGYRTVKCVSARLRR